MSAPEAITDIRFQTERLDMDACARDALLEDTIPPAVAEARENSSAADAMFQDTLPSGNIMAARVSDRELGEGSRQPNAFEYPSAGVLKGFVYRAQNMRAFRWARRPHKRDNETSCTELFAQAADLSTALSPRRDASFLEEFDANYARTHKPEPLGRHEGLFIVSEARKQFEAGSIGRKEYFKLRREEDLAIPRPKTYAQYVEAGDKSFDYALRREKAGGLDAAIDEFFASRVQFTGALLAPNLVQAGSGEFVAPETDPTLLLKLGMCYLRIASYSKLQPHKTRFDEHGRELPTKDRRGTLINSSLHYLEEAWSTGRGILTDEDTYTLLNERMKAYELRAVYRRQQGTPVAAEADNQRAIDSLVEGKETIKDAHLTEEIQRLIEAKKDPNKSAARLAAEAEARAREFALHLVAA